MRQPLGQTFAPTSAADDETRKRNPAQQAIQVLSMRMPRVRGARAISPLVGDARSAAASQVGGFSPESAVLQTLMRTLTPSAPMGAVPGMGGDPVSAAMAALGGGMMNAAPSVTPGIADPNRPIPPIVPAPTPAPTIVPGSPTEPLPAPDDRGWRSDLAAPQRVPKPAQAPSPSPVPGPPRPKLAKPPTPPPPSEPEFDPRILRALIGMFGGSRA